MNESMYDRIMNLPLFKGTSHDQISSFLEKTKLNFQKFACGEEIAAHGDSCHELILVIGGTVSIDYFCNDEELLLREICGEGTMIGSDTLFGLYQQYPFRITAGTDCSILRIDKLSFQKLIMSDNIYLVNILNQLSLKIQRTRAAICSARSNSLPAIIRFLMMTLPSRNASDIYITSDYNILSRLTALPEAKVIKHINLLAEKGIIELTDHDLMRITAREMVLD